MNYESGGGAVRVGARGRQLRTPREGTRPTVPNAA